jgi:3-oxoacyl-[acyl-carrier-protein] synthase III
MYIGGLNYNIGKSKEVSSLLLNDKERLKLLNAAGIFNYRETDLNPFENAKIVAKKALSLSNLEPKEIDMVIYGIEPSVNASNNWIDTYSNDKKDIKWLLKNLDINALPFGLGHFNCTSFLSAIDLAEKYLQNALKSNILVVLSANSDENAMLPRFSNDNTVQSDGACAFIVSKNKLGGLELLVENLQIENIDMRDAIDDSGKIHYYKYGTIKCIKISDHVNDFYTDLELEKTDIKKFVIPNINISTMNLYQTLAEFSKEQLFTDNLEKYGHLIGIDNLVTLQDLIHNKEVSQNDLIHIMGISGMQIGSVLVRIGNK